MVREDYQSQLIKRGICEIHRSEYDGGLWLYRKEFFLRSFDWNFKLGIPRNPIDFANWLIWFDNQKWD